MGCREAGGNTDSISLLQRRASLLEADLCGIIPRHIALLWHIYVWFPEDIMIKYWFNVNWKTRACTAGCYVPWWCNTCRSLSYEAHDYGQHPVLDPQNHKLRNTVSNIQRAGLNCDIWDWLTWKTRVSLLIVLRRVCTAPPAEFSMLIFLSSFWSAYVSPASAVNSGPSSEDMRDAFHSPPAFLAIYVNATIVEQAYILSCRPSASQLGLYSVAVTQAAGPADRLYVITNPVDRIRSSAKAQVSYGSYRCVVDGK